mgnify:CR=1 FL=1
MELIKGPNRRVHVLSPQEWTTKPGTDFWFLVSQNGMFGAGNAHELADFGWTTTGLTLTSAVGAADLLDPTDVGTPAGITLADASDLLTCPAVFGDYAHGLMAQAFLGYFPQTLNLEVYASFTAAAANETATGFGLTEDGGTATTAADNLAFIVSDGTNIAMIGNNAGTTDTGPTVAAAGATPHLYKIQIKAGTPTSAEWFYDGTSQGTVTMVEDEYPVKFSACVQAAGANDIVIHWVHVWYE